MGRVYSEEMRMMNIQPGGASACKSIRQQNSMSKDTGKAAICNLIASVVQAALFILVIGAFFHMYIKLDQEINAASAEIRKVDERIASLDRDIEGLKGRYARCSSRADAVTTHIYYLHWLTACCRRSKRSVIETYEPDFKRF